MNKVFTLRLCHLKSVSFHYENQKTFSGAPIEIPSPKSGTHYTITKLLWSRDLGGFTFLSVFERGHMTKIVINDRNYDRIITSIIMFREICVN